MRNIQSRRFTLLELLAVIGIITVLAAIIIGGVSAGMRKASEAKTRSRMHQLEVALEQYRRDWGYYPVSANTTSAWKHDPADLTNDPTKVVHISPTDSAIIWIRWDDAFLRSPSNILYVEGYPVDTGTTDDNIFNDGFDNPFYYRCPGTRNPQSYDLWSAGANGLFGTAKTTDPAESLKLTDTTDNDDITNWRRQ